MQGPVALWIDHRQAVMAFLAGEAHEVKRIESDMEKHVRYSSHEGGAEDARDRRFAGHLARYYDEVVAAVRDAEAILILGPGEAKHELEKRLRDHGAGDRIVAVETADKMTDHQVAAEGRRRFAK